MTPINTLPQHRQAATPKQASLWEHGRIQARVKAKPFEEILWRVTLLSMFVPAVSPVLWGGMRPPLAYFMLAAWVFKAPQIKVGSKEILLILFAMCASCSFFWNGSSAKATTYLTYLFFVYGVLILSEVQRHFSNQRLQNTLRFLVLCGVLNGILGIWESYSLSLYSIFREMTNASFYLQTTNIGGWLSDRTLVRSAVLCVEPGFYASIQALVLPLCFVVSTPKGGSRYFWFRWIAPMIILMSIYLSFGRTGWLALLAGPLVMVVVYALYHLGFSRRFLRRVTITTLLFIAAISPYYIHSWREHIVQNYAWNNNLDLSIRGRLFSMTEGIRIASENPIQGVGPGITGQFYSGMFFDGNPPPSVLNLFINIAAELGFPALIFFLIYLICCFFTISELAFAYKNRSYYMVQFCFVFLLFIWCMVPDMRMAMFMYILSLSAFGSSVKAVAPRPSLQGSVASPPPKIRRNGSGAAHHV